MNRKQSPKKQITYLEKWRPAELTMINDTYKRVLLKMATFKQDLKSGVLVSLSMNRLIIYQN